MTSRKHYNFRSRDSTPTTSPSTQQFRRDKHSDEDEPDSPLNLHRSMSSSYESLSKSNIYPDLDDSSDTPFAGVETRQRQGSFGSPRKNKAHKRATDRNSDMNESSFLSTYGSDNERIAGKQNLASPKESLYPKVGGREPINRTKNVVRQTSPRQTSPIASRPTKMVPKKTTPLEKKGSVQIFVNMCVHNVVNRESKYLLPLIIVLICILLGTFMYLFSVNTPDKQLASVKLSAREQEFEVFKNQVKQLQKSFPSQSSKFWRTIRAALKHIIVEEEPEYPSTLLFAVPRSASNVASCISTKVSKALNKIFNITTVNYLDVTTLNNLNANDEKMELDRFLTSKLSESGSAVVIDHFEDLAPNAALLMHSYSDGDNAPVKRAMLALVYYMNVEKLSNRDDVEKSLMKLWEKDLDMDKIGALLSRIANNIVAISPEGVDTVMHIC